MLDRPDPQMLLMGLASFLTRDVRPALDDKALSFRVLIAAHVASTLALQSQAADDARIAALERLRGLVPDVVDEIPLRERDRIDLLERGETTLAERIREGAVSPDAARDHVRALLSDTLRLTSPRFDLSDRIE